MDWTVDRIEEGVCVLISEDGSSGSMRLQSGSVREGDVLTDIAKDETALLFSDRTGKTVPLWPDAQRTAVQKARMQALLQSVLGNGKGATNRMEKVDRSKWKRSAWCDFFGALEVPFYSVTFRLDVTALHAYAKAHGLSFYAGMIWVTMRAINRTDAFLYEIHGEDVYRNAYLNPSYTYPYDGDLFGINTIPWNPDEPLSAFAERMKHTEADATSPLPTAEEDEAGHNVYLSCLPWFDYLHVAQEFPMNRDDSTPRVLWGRFTEDSDGRLTLAYTVQVNHRLIDGVHLHYLYEALLAELNQFAKQE